MSNETLTELVRMSRYLGDAARTYAILGEGNSSARLDADTFYVKASGTQLGTIDANGFVRLSISRVLEVLDDDSADDESITEALRGACVDPTEARRPSVEAMLHALLLQYEGCCFVGHTHPVYTNMILCSMDAERIVHGRICPDHIVVMGHTSVYVPYVDPGLVLAREVRTRVADYVAKEGVLPKAILMQNHGLIALGPTAGAVTNITDMTEKISQILVGTAAFGGPRFMPADQVDRIYTRPDEKYRINVIKC